MLIYIVKYLEFYPSINRNIIVLYEGNLIYNRITIKLYSPSLYQIIFMLFFFWYLVFYSFSDFIWFARSLIILLAIIAPFDQATASSVPFIHF
jgi:hypothetical protein